MRLKDWFILVSVLLVGGLVFTMWSDYCYRRGYEAGAEMVLFDA